MTVSEWVDDWDLDDPEGSRGYRAPHCDSRVCHAPGVCDYCDNHPAVQAARLRAGVAFTGDSPGPGQRPCPADAARPAGSAGDHRRWGGNKPTSAVGDPSWPRETFASHVMYGDRGGRVEWPLRERMLRRAARPIEDASYWLRGWEHSGGLRTWRVSSRPRGGRAGQYASAVLMFVARKMR